MASNASFKTLSINAKYSARVLELVRARGCRTRIESNQIKTYNIESLGGFLVGFALIFKLVSMFRGCKDNAERKSMSFLGFFSYLAILGKLPLITEDCFSCVISGLTTF